MITEVRFKLQLQMLQTFVLHGIESVGLNTYVCHVFFFFLHYIPFLTIMSDLKEHSNTSRVFTEVCVFMQQVKSTPVLCKCIGEDRKKKHLQLELKGCSVFQFLLCSMFRHNYLCCLWLMCQWQRTLNKSIQIKDCAASHTHKHPENKSQVTLSQTN